MSLVPFVKDDSYEPDHEYRILFTTHMEKILNHLVIDEYERIFLNDLNREKKFIEMPLNNSLFELKVEDVIVFKKCYV